MKKFYLNLLIVGLFAALFTSCEPNGGNGKDPKPNDVCNKAWINEEAGVVLEIITNDDAFITYYDQEVGLARYHYAYVYDDALKTIDLGYEGQVAFSFEIQEDGTVYNELNDLYLAVGNDLEPDSGKNNIFKNTKWATEDGEYSIDFLTNQYCGIIGLGSGYTFNEEDGTIEFTTYEIKGTFTDNEITVANFFQDGSAAIFIKQ